MLMQGTGIAVSQLMARVFSSRASINAACIAGAVLAVLGLVLHPVVLHEKGLLGCAANLAELAFYSWLAGWSPLSRSFEARASSLARQMGWGVGVWLGIDLVGNYLVYRSGATNQLISLIVYGVYLAGLVGVAGWAAYSHRSWGTGLRTAFWYVIPAQLTWLVFEFGSFYLLGPTPGGQKFLHEEMAQDMARSGSTNFEAFTMGDFYGAGFLHLLIIGLGVALVLGSAASLVGTLAARLRPLQHRA